MFKKILLGLVLLISLTSIYAEQQDVSCNGTLEKPCIVQDTFLNAPSVRNWRDAKSLTEATKQIHGNTLGLDTLWMSGSAAPSSQGFKTIVKNIKSATQNKVERIVNIDLRQETHAYLNKNAITLATRNNLINKGKSREEVLQDEKDWITTLSHEPLIENVISHQKFKMKQYHGGKTYIVKEVTDESTEAEAANLRYVRLMVTDHMAPSDSEVDRFIKLVRNLEPHTWLHFHCRGGDGRTTTFMVMYDMLHNADKVSLEDIVKRQASAGPHYDVLELPKQNPELTKFYEERTEFVKKFYQYAQAYRRGYTGSWSKWNTTN